MLYQMQTTFTRSHLKTAASLSYYRVDGGKFFLITEKLKFQNPAQLSWVSMVGIFLNPIFLLNLMIDHHIIKKLNL